MVNFDGGLGLQHFTRLAIDAGVNALAAVSLQRSPNLFGVGDAVSFNADSSFGTININAVPQPMTAISGGVFSGGVWSVAVGQNGSVLDRRTGSQPRLTTIGAETFIDVWAAETFDSYLLATGPGPQVVVRAADGGVTKEELPIRQARGLFGLDTVTGHQVWVTGAEGTILRRDSR